MNGVRAVEIRIQQKPRGMLVVPSRKNGPRSLGLSMEELQAEGIDTEQRPTGQMARFQASSRRALDRCKSEPHMRPCWTKPLRTRSGRRSRTGREGPKSCRPGTCRHKCRHLSALHKPCLYQPPAAFMLRRVAAACPPHLLISKASTWAALASFVLQYLALAIGLISSLEVSCSGSKSPTGLRLMRRQGAKSEMLVRRGVRAPIREMVQNIKQHFMLEMNAKALCG